MKQEILDLISLDGKVAVITGGASGIGLSTARLLSSAGASVALIDKNASSGAEEAAAIESDGGTCRFYSCDISSDEACRAAVTDIIRDFTAIDILFNNAGIIKRKNAVDLEPRDWDISLDVNLKGVYLMSRQVIPYMIRRGGGVIINTGSGWSLKGGPEAVSYCASKAGVLNLTRAMAIDHGKYNIRVNCVCPGDIDTPLLRGEAAQLGRDEAEFLREAAARPLARIGKPEDVARAVLFLASDLSSWVTGAHLLVDGGGLA